MNSGSASESQQYERLEEGQGRRNKGEDRKPASQSADLKAQVEKKARSKIEEEGANTSNKQLERGKDKLGKLGASVRGFSPRYVGTVTAEAWL